VFVGAFGECYTTETMNHEIDRFLEANPELLQQFADTFLARWDTYPFQLVDGSYTRSCTYQADGSKNYHPLSIAHLEEHLKGRRTLGAYLLDRSSVTRRIVFDDDSEAGMGRLLEVAQDLARQDIPCQLEKSSRGGHLWVHTPPLLGRDARRIGIYLLKERGLTTRDIELYPKQNFLHGDHVGSLVRLPFGIHRKTGKVYGFVDLEGRDLADRRREQLQMVAHPQRVSQEVIDHILAAAPEMKRRFTVDWKRFKGAPAGMTPDERIKRAISAYDYISQFVDLDSNGRGLCPFHDDHKQSFKVYDDGWHCFAGCEGHTIIDFHIKMRGYPSLKLSPEDWKHELWEMMKELGL